MKDRIVVCPQCTEISLIEIALKSEDTDHGSAQLPPVPALYVL
jgi:hypothetical protein